MRKLIKEKIIFGNCFIQMPGILLTPHYLDGESYFGFMGKVSDELSNCFLMKPPPSQRDEAGLSKHGQDKT